jgi:hypothetical protein
MRSTKWTKQLVVQGIIMVVAQGGIAFADAPAPKWYDSTTLSGYVQGTYIGNISKDTPKTNQLRAFDPDLGFGLPQAQLKLSRPVADDSAGFVVKFLTGTNAKLIHSTGLGTTEAFDLEEANMTFNVPKVKGLTFTGGKFVTSCGVEVIESPSNLMIEPGLLFLYGMPFTHTGGKFGYTVNDKLSVSAGVVNGWDQVQDQNSGKTIIANVSATPIKAFSVGLTGSYGPDLFGTSSSTTALPSGNPNISKREHVDLVLGYTGIDKLSLSLEGLWGQDTNTGGVADSATTPWAGAGFWAGYAQSDYLNPGIRVEVFRDNANSGTGRLTAPNSLTALPQTAKSLTLVNKFVVNKNTALRLEYRHDWSTVAAYTRNDGTGVRNQNTISADWVVTF